MIDLHIHTTYSDGTDSVEELLKNAEKKKLEVISITDHDSVEAYFELEKRPELKELYSGKIIPGAELRAVYEKVNIEILGYGIDPHKIQIVPLDQYKIQTEVLAYFKKVAQELGIKYNDEVQIQKDNPAYLYASHTFAREILNYPENQRVFEKIGFPLGETSFYRFHESNKKSPFYFDNSKYYPEIEEVIDIIHKAGGLAFLAHGYMYPFENRTQTIQKILETTLIDGAECEYSLFSQEQRAEIKGLCKKAGKFQSGGSDYHSENKPNIKLGTGIDENLKIQRNLITDWENRVSFIEK